MGFNKRGSDVSGSYKRERRGRACKMPQLQSAFIRYGEKR